jgi:hypothetical protein
VIIAIHQPNYLPWLGYFHKIARADVFVLLDDVQFSKNSYSNRVRVLQDGTPRWLTLPVTAHLGDRIDQVRPADPQWPTRHRDRLFQYYRRAPAFAEMWPRLEAMYADLSTGDLAAINRTLVETVAGWLGLACRFVASSAFDTAGAAGDDRLIRLVRAIDPTATYLSGRGGANYQDETKFSAAGIGFACTDFIHPVYPQQCAPFVPGLSVVDALFHAGCDRVAEWLTAGTSVPAADASRR